MESLKYPFTVPGNPEENEPIFVVGLSRFGKTQQVDAYRDYSSDEMAAFNRIASDHHKEQRSIIFRKLGRRTKENATDMWNNKLEMSPVAIGLGALAVNVLADWGHTPTVGLNVLSCSGLGQFLVVIGRHHYRQYKTHRRSGDATEKTN